MDILKLITSNIVMLMQQVGLFIFLRVGVHLSRKMVIFTRLSMILLLLNSIIFNLEAYTQTFETLSILRPILTGFVYILNPLILVVAMQIVKPFTKKEMLMLIPLGICVPIFLTSQWTHIVCFFTQGNHYQGGYISNLPYFLFGFYLIIFLIRSFIGFRHSHSWDRLSLIYIVGSGILAVGLYLFTDYSSDYSAIFTACLILYYLYVYIQSSKVDPLTGLKNRQCYYREMQLYRSKITAVVSADMNDLKRINDTEGHSAGDLALKTVSECMNVREKISKQVYRVGGDEFMIFYSGAKEEDVLRDISDMKERLGKTDYIVAFGYAMVDPKETMEEAILRSDNAMYQEKARLKELPGERTGAPEMKGGLTIE
ncbi:MAG: GGDEF domain-containing protein [Clostridia bacterium]|nr:GGDEF domain-containing protein [Clostridia bacterium]